MLDSIEIGGLRMEKSGKKGNNTKEKAFQLEDIIRRVIPTVSLEDLILPQATLSQLEEICNQAREIYRLPTEPGIDRRSLHDKGLILLFTGPPESGKTKAAEAIAYDLGMPILKIDFGAVSSKYISEIAKNLGKILDMAENSNAILLFDEADVLFGKRTSISDSHDSFANSETSYLLQRVEDHKGLVVLASNFRHNFDRAFLRRMGYIVKFFSQPSI